MRRLMLLWTVGCCIAAPACASPRPALPLAKPDWSCPLPWPERFCWDERLFLTPDAALVSATHGACLAAIHRSNGRLLWRISPPETGASETLRRISGVTRDGAITLLSIRTAQSALDGGPSEVTEAAQGVETRTGHVVWEHRLASYRWGSKRTEPPSWVQGCVGDLAVVRTGRVGISLRDMHSGAELLPGRDQEAITRAAAAGPDPITVLDDDAGVYILHLATGLRTYVAKGGPQVLSHALYRRQAVLNIDSDSGVLGGSSNPKYLLGVSLSGFPLWSFPTTREFSRHPVEFSGAWCDIERMALLPESGMLLASNGPILYGLRARNGKVRWRKPAFGQVNGWVSAGSSAWVLQIPATEANRPPPHQALCRVDGRSGKARWIARVPYAPVSVMDEDVLYTVGQLLSAFSLKQLARETRRGLKAEKTAGRPRSGSRPETD